MIKIGGRTIDITLFIARIFFPFFSKPGPYITHKARWPLSDVAEVSS